MILNAIIFKIKILKYRKVAYVGHIGNMVRNDFDHKKSTKIYFL